MTDARWQFVTWLLVISGWVVVHYLSVVRERQKEIRDLKNQLVEFILQIESDAISFHQSAGHNAEAARVLVTNISRVGAAIAELPLSKLGVASKVIKEFRKSVTLRNFDSTRFSSQLPNGKLIGDITRCADELIAALNNSYACRYLGSWWQCFRV